MTGAAVAAARSARADAEAISEEFSAHGVTAVPWQRRGCMGVAVDYPGGHMIGECSEVRDELLRRLRPGAGGRG